MARIDSVPFGEIIIDGKTYYSDMVVWWDGKTEYRAKTRILGMDEFTALFSGKPEAIVVGTGQTGSVKILPEVLQAADDMKIKLFIDKSPNAADIFNGLVADGKKVVAIIRTTS